MSADLAELAFLQHRQVPRPRVLVVSPHPDDEVIGAGSRLPLLSGATVVQVTNGSPEDECDAIEAGYRTGAEYGLARARELQAALAICGIERTVELSVPDQRAAYNLNRMTQELGKIVEALRPDFILTVPFEGGHPDHDATAFAVHQACRLDPTSPPIIEMLSYHDENGCCVMDRFLDESEPVLTICLSEAEITWKRRLFDCFTSQRKVLQWFPIGLEKFRWAPRYDFTRPPHSGQLYYERFNWGLTAERWCELVAAALMPGAELLSA